MDAPCAAVKRRAFGAVLIPALWLVASAHVGSPDVVYDGSAGAYAVRVIVRPPNVVPGLADVVVRVNASDARRVTIQPVFWKTGVSGAPIGDEARRVAGEANLYSGQVWLMSRGAYSVYVNVEGARGSGTAVVPVNSIATARLGMSPFLGGILVVLGGVLIAGLITIVRAAAGEGVLPPGQVADASVRRRANRFALIATPLFAVLVFGGAKWWNTVDAAYRRTMFRPPAVDVALSANGLLQLNVHDTASYRALFAPVVPDHGKMMHLFIVSEPDHLVFAHLHPVQGDSLHFSTTLPPLPAGHYRLFGDLTIETGASFTVTNTFDVGSSASNGAPADSDDAWLESRTLAPANRGAIARLGGGSTLTWLTNGPIVARRPLDLAFEVKDSAGRVAALQPFLGMAAHAVVLASDDSVFIHLHPMGTVTAAAQQIFQARDRGDTTARGRLRADAVISPAMDMSYSGSLSFPYEFPKAGRYRMWVQVKRQNRILTGAFDIDVRGSSN